MSDSECWVLDLFCGLGGFSSAFEESGRWAVTTVDIKAEFDPDIQADVFDLRPSDFEQEFDVILASPPCNVFTMAASIEGHIVDGEPRTEAAQNSVALVYHTLGLIRSLAPTYWFLENPQGYLRKVIGDPEARVTYCQYGENWMKPTDLWGNHPPMTYHACAYGDNCHTHNTDQEHGGLGNCNASGTRDPAERAKVPYDLSKAIRDACEQALDGNAPEQLTIDQLHT